MPAITKEQFQQAAIDALGGYPNVAQYVKAGDPRVLAQIGAQATMLAMMAATVDVAKFEPFVKSRDGTVLADAALKGILPLGRACRVTLSIQNTDAQQVTLGSQRRYLDAKGRLYELDSTVVIEPGGTATATATQIRRRSLTSKISVANDFYSLPVSLSSDELFLNTLVVYRGLEEFAYAPDWFNVAPGQLAYQVEVDELRQMFVKFGKSTVIGYGVAQGDEFTLDITECNGRIVDLAPGSDFNLEYILTSYDAGLKATLLSVEDEGAAPATMPELRVMARYPAIYDHNAVYLGEFEFLLRRYITGIRFLSVWNEQIEEGVRGADVDNINTLFVSGLVTGMTNAAFEERVTTLLRRADTSYRIRFVPPVLVPVPMTITGSIAISWDRATVESQIRSLILTYYGDGSINVSQGMKQPIKKSQINKLLRENIDALRDEKAEFDVAVTLPVTPLPEHFLYIASASLTVNVSSLDYGTSLWNS
jgi:hypothetical protein